MKKLLCILFALFVGFSVNAQDARKSQKALNVQNLNKKEVNALFQRTNPQQTVVKGKEHLNMQNLNKKEVNALFQRANSQQTVVKGKEHLNMQDLNRKEVNKSNQRVDVKKVEYDTSVGKHEQIVTATPMPRITRDPIQDGYARIVLSVGDVWGDGTGYQMLLDADANTYGTTIPVDRPLGITDVPTSTYNLFEYKIPTNADGMLTTSNVVLNNSLFIDIPAGAYDYCITNPSPIEDMSGLWIAGGDLSRGNDYVFEEGYTYFFSVELISREDGDLVLLEISAYDIDAEVVSISTPVSGVNLTDAETVTATIKNKGTSTITGFTLTLNVNGDVVATETYTGSIAVGGQANYTFTATADLFAAGSHAITVTANLTGDEDAANNSKTINVTNTICDPIATFPWTEGFEGAGFPPSCWTSNNVDGDGVEWIKNTTASRVHEGVASAYHTYSTTINQEGWLVTPPIAIPATGNYTFSFWSYNFYPEDNRYNGIWISTTSNDPSTFTEVKQLTGDELSPTFQQISIPLSEHAGQSIYIAFKYAGLNGDGWAIDDVAIMDFSNFTDAQVVSITTPVSGLDLGDETVTAVIKNNGSAPITNFDISFDVNGADVVTETYTGTIASLSQVEYTFTATADLSAAGNHTIRVYTSLTDDQNPANDTATITITNTVCNAITTFPWEEGFENAEDLGCWTTEYVTETETADWIVYGGNVLGSMLPHTGNYNLLFFYDDYTAAVTKLITPQMDLTSLTNPVLKFWHGQEAWGADQDELRVYYKTSATGTWTMIAEFTDNIPAWTEAMVALPNGTDDYYIAFEGTGKYGVGVVIDDVTVIDFTGVIDAQVVFVTNPTSGNNLGDEETVTAVIKNGGSNPITNFDISLQVNGTDVATETYTGTIASLSQVEYTFTATADFSAAGNHTIRVYTSLTDDQNAANDTVTITITNNVCDAITTFPWEENFTNELSACWLNIDHDGDDFSWTFGTLNGNRVAASESWFDDGWFGQALTPDNWLITPQIILDNSYSLLFDIGAIDNNYYAEKYSVLVSTTGTEIEDFTAIHTETLTEGGIKTVALDLTDYEGESIYIAFRHWDCTDENLIVLDNIKIFDFANFADAAVTEITAPTTGNLTDAETVTVMVKNNGGSAITGFTLALEVNDSETVTDTYTGSIASLAQAEHTFSVPVDMSALDSYTITVTVNVTDDQVADNNTITKTVAKFSSDPITLYGYRIYDDEYETIDFKGVVSFNSNNPAIVTSVNNYTDGTDGINSMSAGEFLDGTLYLYSRVGISPYSPVNFIKLSTSTWTATTTPVSAVCIDMTYDYSTNTMYGIASGASGTSELYTVNLETGAMTLVGDLGDSFYTLACNLDGDMFAVSTSGILYSINQTNATTATIASTGITPAYIQSMAFDHNTGRLFWAMCNDADEGKLVEVNPTSGNVLDLGTLGGNAEVVALYTPYYSNLTVMDKTPADGATNVEPNATVSVTFNMDITAADLSGVTINPNPGNVSASVSGSVLTIAHDAFAPNTQYTVTVPAGVIQNYDAAITWAFTTKTAGISTLDANNINMYPNPSDGTVNLTNLPHNSTVTVFDLTGRMLSSYNNVTSSLTMDVRFAAGAYIVKIENENNVAIKKLIVK